MSEGSRISGFQGLSVHLAAFVLLWIFIFCVPWEEEAAVSGGLAMSHLVGAAAGIAGILACVSNGRMRRPGPVFYLAVLLVVWSSLSWCWSIAPDLTTVRVASSIQLLLMVWLIWEFARSEGRQLALLGAYVTGAFVAALSTIRSFVTGTGDNKDLIVGRYTAPGSNENELGIILALSLAMAGYLLAMRKGPRAFWFVHIPVCLLAILLTGSRGSFIATGVALLIFPFTLGSFSRKEKVLGSLALVTVSAAGLAFVPRATWLRMESIGSEVSEGTLTKRTYIWGAGLEVYRQHPMLGVGAGAFEASVYNRLGIPYVAHNSYLSVLVELGAVGLILFLALLAALYYAAFRLPRPARMAWLILLTTWAIAVMSLTWEHRKPTWFLFGLLMAQAAGIARPRARKRARASAVSESAPAFKPPVFAFAQQRGRRF